MDETGEKEKTFFNYAFISGIIVLVILIPWFLYERFKPFDTKLSPIIFGLTVFEVIALIITILITLIIAIIYPYKFIFNIDKIVICYIFKKNLDVNWKNIKQISLDNQIFKLKGIYIKENKKEVFLGINRDTIIKNISDYIEKEKIVFE
jgi:hypothetical protein